MADLHPRERADAPAKGDLRKTEGAKRMAKADLRNPEAQANPPRDKAARCAALGDVLQTALVIVRQTRLKEQANWLGDHFDPPRAIDERQVARWFNGTEGVPWDQVLLIRDLQFPLAQALLEACQADVVEIRTSISKRVAA